MSSNTSSALRPGIALGRYPECEPSDPGFLDAAAEKLLRLWRPLRKELQADQLQAFVIQVNKEAEKLPLNEKSFSELAVTLQQLLLREGLTDQLVAASFALVRAAAEDTVGMRHYDTQLKAGRILLCGALAEMETGEGKTLTATLAACTAALAGIPVHVVTANDYLVGRDAAAMGPVYRALGLSVGAISESSTPPMRRQAYARNVTYNTSKQLAFDYLRDRIALGKRRGTVSQRIKRLHSQDAGNDSVMMRGLCYAIIDEADSVLIDEARTPFVIANERDSSKLEVQCRHALQTAATLKVRVDYVLDINQRRAQLSESGRDKIDQLPDKLALNTRACYAMVEQALAALHLFHKDRDYLVRDESIQIIDPNTGRLMEDRSWSRGLHQLVEIKENCTVSAPRDTLAQLTFQRFFRRYLRIGGMTGTAREVADELWHTYRLPVVTLATHRPSQRRRLPDQVCADMESKWINIVERVKDLHATGRPILIGTRSVAASEHLSGLLNAAGLKHELLNARQNAAEARIVACAGNMGQITVATNMAGRGTDIALAPGVAELGGLHVIATERNDARRLDRQLSGRCGRHGEPGSYEVFHTLDDEVIGGFWMRRLRWLQNLGLNQRITDIMLIQTIALAQKRCERRHRNERRDLSIMQDHTDRLLSFSGEAE